MPKSRTANQPVVFISYAHESAAFRESVKHLADWLAEHSCRVLTDHGYGYRPPAEGWQAWMLGCIDWADIVLVVCTPRLKARYEKTESPGTGFGGTYEGAIVTQRIYDAQMRNTKFYPILPDEGTLDDVPTTLKAWWNGHRFPSGYEGICRMIFDEPVLGGELQSEPSGDAQSREPRQSYAAHHLRLTIRLLAADGATPFFEALKNEFSDEYPETAIPRSATEMVRHFAECSADEVQELFYRVRRALRTLPPKENNRLMRKQAEEAAAALYCLAACRLVIDATVSAANYTFQVPSSERVICAIIATALFGGELRLLPTEQPGLPCPEYVFEVRVPAAGDHVVGSFERAVYITLFQNDRDAPELGLDSEPLNDRQIRRLAARLRTIKHVDRASLALIVHGLVESGVAQPFADKHFVPVMFPASEATNALLGMDAGDLVEEIREFWGELQILPHPQTPAHTPPSSQSSSGAPAMSKSDPPGIHIQVTGNPNIAFATGDHSAAQTGANSVANVGHREETDLAALTPLLQELLAAIGELPSAKAREALTAQVLAAKKDPPEPGRIKQAVDAIKPAAEALEGGEKILALCGKVYRLLGPLLGLPTLPLP